MCSRPTDECHQKGRGQSPYLVQGLSPPAGRCSRHPPERRRQEPLSGRCRVLVTMALTEPRVATHDNFPALFFAQAERLADRVAMRQKEFGIWRRISWNDYARNVRWVAHALLALGLERGDRVAIIGENRPEWLYADVGAQAAGGVVVGIYATSSPEQVQYIMAHSESRFIIVEGEEQLDKLLELRAALPHLERIIVMDPEGLRTFADPQVSMFGEFLRIGEQHARAHPQAVDDRLAAAAPDDVMYLIYTSGTTGTPKGVMLTS